MNSLFPAEGTFPQNYVAGQQRLQISEFEFDKFTTPSAFSCWKIKFKTQVSACSSSPSEAMLWIKEVEMVDSVGDLKSSRSIQGYTHFQNFEMVDARIASALNKIIQNFYFKKKVSLEEQNAQKEEIGSFAEDRSPTLSTTTSGLLALIVQFLITLPFAMMMFRNSIRDGMNLYCP